VFSVKLVLFVECLVIVAIALVRGLVDIGRSLVGLGRGLVGLGRGLVGLDRSLVVLDDRLGVVTALSEVPKVVLVGEYVFGLVRERNVRTVFKEIRGVGLWVYVVEVASGSDGGSDSDAMIVRVVDRTGAERGWYVSRLRLGILVKRI
jgi:hypothetical protein